MIEIGVVCEATELRDQGSPLIAGGELYQRSALSDAHKGVVAISSLPSLQSAMPSPTLEGKMLPLPSEHAKILFETRRCEQADVLGSSLPSEQSQ